VTLVERDQWLVSHGLDRSPPLDPREQEAKLTEKLATVAKQIDRAELGLRREDDPTTASRIERKLERLYRQRDDLEERASEDAWLTDGAPRCASCQRLVSRTDYGIPKCICTRSNGGSPK
jgi:hypothetical protein